MMVEAMNLVAEATQGSGLNELKVEAVPREQQTFRDGTWSH
jgi:hypothetical protein